MNIENIPDDLIPEYKWSCIASEESASAALAKQLIERIAKLEAENKAMLEAMSKPVDHSFGLMDCEMNGADPCKCGAGWIPKAVDGVLWYWQRHSRESCTLELPDIQCWCGLKRSGHINGHRTLMAGPRRQSRK